MALPFIFHEPTDLNTLREEAFSHLLLSAEATATVGSRIDVGEKFTERFTVTNTFSGSNGERPGHAHFTNVKLRVSGTQFAEVEGGNRTIPVTNHLGYGNSATIEVTFIARDTLTIFGLEWQEPYANVTLEADFDIERFFRIVREEQFWTQITEG